MEACYATKPHEAMISVVEDTAYIVLCQDIRYDADKDWYICDEHQIICPADAIDLDDVRANPAKYMDYEYRKSVPPDPAEERMQELEDAIIELAEIIGG